jgi:hypothetical protein
MSNETSSTTGKSAAFVTQMDASGVAQPGATSAKQDDIISALGGSSGLTYTLTTINEAAGATIDLGGNAAAKYARLHTLVLTMDVLGTVTVKDDSDGAGGGTPVAQSGDILLGAGGGISFDIENPERCMESSVVNRHMTLVTTQGCNGYAVVSAGA